MKIDKSKIKNRWKTLKKKFSDYYDIFKNGMSGFAWNPSTHLWDAEPEVWDALIQVTCMNFYLLTCHYLIID